MEEEQTRSSLSCLLTIISSFCWESALRELSADAEEEEPAARAARAARIAYGSNFNFCRNGRLDRLWRAVEREQEKEFEREVGTSLRHQRISAGNLVFALRTSKIPDAKNWQVMTCFRTTHKYGNGVFGGNIVQQKGTKHEKTRVKIGGMHFYAKLWGMRFLKASYF